MNKYEQYLEACKFFSDNGNVLNDPENLKRTEPTTGQLEMAVQFAMRKGFSEECCKLHAACIQEYWSKKRESG